MHKYKSDIINEEDLRINVSTRTKEGIVVSRIVEVEYTPLKLLVSAEDSSQLEAYKKAIKLIEERVLNVAKNL
jgi:hypothetical protein